MKTELLAIETLNVTFHDKTGPKPLVKRLDLTIPKGKMVEIIDESGNGKSVAMKNVMDLLPDKVTGHYASYTFEGVAATDRRTLPIAMISQNPMTSLNPLRAIGYHLIEVIHRSQNVSRKAAQEITVKELGKVGIPFPVQRMKQYPHELSGGMYQQAMIVMARSLYTSPSPRDVELL